MTKTAANFHPHGRPTVRRRLVLLLSALVLGALFVGTASAQSRPTWFVQDSVASVEAFAVPSQVPASDVKLVVSCDAEAPEGVNVGMFVGTYAVPLPERLDVLVRIDRQPPRRAEWITNEQTPALPMFYYEVSNIFDDLRSGTVFAARLFLFDGVDDASQPTFQFDVSGFVEVEGQLGCSRPGDAVDDPFATELEAPTDDPFATEPEAPAVPASPVAPSSPATPSSPTRPSTPSVTPWEISGTGVDTLMIAISMGGTLAAACDSSLPLPMPTAFIIVDGTPAAGRAFSVRFADGDVLEVTNVEGNLHQITPAGLPFLGGTNLLIAGFDPSGFDVTAVFPDGSEVLLLRAAGGEDFFDAWDELPCNSSSDAPAAPSAPSRSVAPAASSAGSWSIEGDGTLLSFRDARGRSFGWICAGDQDPFIYLELPDVAVPTSDDGIASFSFARANGTRGGVTWRFANSSGNSSGSFFVTDYVATEDLASRLLPDEGSTSWNDLNVTLAGQGTVLRVAGQLRIAELFGQLTCVR